MSESPALSCPICQSQQVQHCAHLRQVPIYCNILYHNQSDALAAPLGDIDLCFCQRCGHLYNSSFAPGLIDYSGGYENSLHYSDRFDQFARSLATQLLARHNLRRKTVIEIACGSGDFLRLLCTQGNNRGIGFDPSQASGHSGDSPDGEPIFIRDYYSRQYRHYEADLICCRHALEHMPKPADFLQELRDTIGDTAGDAATGLYFEVPNALFTLHDLGIWDLIYEHCGYFTEHSLRTVFERSGFLVEQVDTGFGGQFLGMHASPRNTSAAPGNAIRSTRKTPPTAALTALVNTFESHYTSKVAGWSETLRELQREGKKIALWGAGSKGVSFSNTLKIGREIGCLIDLNPRKQGRYIPGTGHQVRAPESLVEYRPDAVIVMNPLYTQEIRQRLEAMDLRPRIIEDISSPQRNSS